ncbi:Late embryogenesis abundant protein [Macleaya cordata]|uniref:Late embryogenesis abundant protein n=1 Tax=Macleaya cordata TaxID=56857 RepID=A0A200R5D9_MACCD|nr:Late embryogenesis abundant protein [Macleaya cordata]
MAGPGSSTTQRTPAGRSSILRCIAITLLALIVIVGLTVLITWLVIRPKKLVYTVEAGKVEQFNIHYNHLNATFDFVLRAYNPNKKVSVYYDSIDVSVSYDDQPIAYQTVQPFFQPRRNITRLELKPTGQAVPLQGSVSRDLRLEKSSGEIQFEVRVKARIRFKVGRWKSSHYTVRVKCSPVEVHLSSPKKFDRTECDVDI